MTPEADGYTRALEAKVRETERAELPASPERKWIEEMANSLSKNSCYAHDVDSERLRKMARAAYAALRAAMKGTGT
jgi:hypothetical protein